MTAQDRSLQQYQQLLQLNAASHLLRIARRVGLFAALSTGQKTAPELIDQLGLRPALAHRLLDALRATGVIEKYGDDFALAQVTRLLCQYDADLGDELWQRLETALTADEAPTPDIERYRNAIAATQWTHTRTAIEAAEMLNIGEDRAAPRIVDIGCGSAVWSCAMAYRDSRSTVTAVDHAAALEAAASTAQSIELGERFSTIEGDPLSVSLPSSAFDMAIIAQRLHSESLAQGSELLERARESLNAGGELIVIDLFETDSDAKMGEAMESLKLELCTNEGAVRTATATERQVMAAGFRKPQFSYLPASPVQMGMLVARKA